MKKTRRNFLGKLGLGLATSLGIGYKGMANDAPQKEEKMNQQHPVINTQALGFQWQTADPFLFCVHHDDKFPKGTPTMGPETSLLKGRNLGQDFLLKDGWRMYHGETVPGFPGHPHRGFETITVVRKGWVDHADSLGGSGRYGNGDVQWMTAGKGIQHSEMFPLLDQEQENPMELFQIWLNLPKKSKMVNAHYKMLWGEDVPKLTFEDDKGNSTLVEVIAGQLGEHRAPAPPPDSWGADPANEVAVWNMRLAPNATWTVPVTKEGINRTLYFYEGDQLEISGKSIAPYHAVSVHPNQELTLQAGAEGAKILMLQGRPIQEPVVQHGPFVMNTREEIQQAFTEFQQTRFGGWPWAKYDQVHDPKLGRFAKDGQGKEEIKHG